MKRGEPWVQLFLLSFQYTFSILISLEFNTIGRFKVHVNLNDRMYLSNIEILKGHYSVMVWILYSESLRILDIFEQFVFLTYMYQELNLRSHFPDSVVVLVFYGADKEYSLPLLQEIVELSRTAVLCNLCHRISEYDGTRAKF